MIAAMVLPLGWLKGPPVVLLAAASFEAAAADAADDCADEFAAPWALVAPAGG